MVELSFHEHDRGEWYFCVEDHGVGLSRETLKAFATFGLSRKARQLERDNTDVDAPDFLSGEIGEFGVGSKQAAFFNGRCISVITAQDSPDKPCSSSVLELEIAADRMDEAYKLSQNPYAGQVNQRARGNVSQSHLSDALLQRASIRDCIVNHETDLRQFTRIMVSQVSMPDAYTPDSPILMLLLRTRVASLSSFLFLSCIVCSSSQKFAPSCTRRRM